MVEEGVGGLKFVLLGRSRYSLRPLHEVHNNTSNSNLLLFISGAGLLTVPAGIDVVQARPGILVHDQRCAHGRNKIVIELGPSQFLYQAQAGRKRT
jgi:hypothetical protein